MKGMWKWERCGDCDIIVCRLVQTIGKGWIVVDISGDVGMECAVSRDKSYGESGYVESRLLNFNIGIVVAIFSCGWDVDGLWLDDR